MSLKKQAVAFAMAVMGTGLLATTSSAQNSTFTTGQPVFSNQQVAEAVTAEVIVDVYEGAGFTSSVSYEDDGSPLITSTNQTGGVIYTLLRDCQNKVCTIVQPYGHFDAQGVTLGQLNNLSLENFNNSEALLLSDGSGIIITKIL